MKVTFKIHIDSNNSVSKPNLLPGEVGRNSPIYSHCKVLSVVLFTSSVLFLFIFLRY